MYQLSSLVVELELDAACAHGFRVISNGAGKIVREDRPSVRPKETFSVHGMKDPKCTKQIHRGSEEEMEGF